MAEGTPADPDESGIDPDSVFVLSRRAGEVAAPGAFATLRLAEAMLRIKREHPDAWRILRHAGVRLNEEIIEQLVKARDNPEPPVSP